jgi:hypothetical protein
MIWLKRDSQGDYYFSPKTKNHYNEGNLAEIESWTVILEKESPIRNVLKGEIRKRVSLLKSPLDDNADAQLPQVA